MTSVSVIFSIVQLCISLQLVTVHAYDPFRGRHGAPIIEPFDPSITLDVNTDKTIECRAEKPVIWISEILNSQDGNVNIVNFVNDDPTSDDKNIYRSNLLFESITSEYVGKYYCVFNSTIKGEPNMEQEVEKYKASAIYIFVNDPDHLLVENHEHAMVIGKQYEPFVIPCKPTSPKVRVELIKEDGEEQIVGSYDPEIGYTVSLTHVEESGTYDCRVRGDPDDFIQFHVMVNENSLTNYLPPPTITSDSKFFATEGNDFQLTCHMELNSGILYTAAFFHEGSRMESNEHMTVSELKHEESNRQKAYVNLTVRQSVESRDSGDYKCTVMDYHNNTNSAIATITFVTEPVIELTSSNRVIFVDKGKKQAQFLIEYTAFPSATFYMYDPKNEQISSDMDVMNRKKYDVIIDEHTVKFKVKYPDITDFGNYTLVATTVGKNFTTTVELFVSDKPTVSMDDVYVMAGEEVHMSCKVLAYPQADITWSFQPCQDLSLWPNCSRRQPAQTEMVARMLMDPETQQDQIVHDESVDSHQSSNIAQVSDIKFTPSQPGSVKCKARNSKGSDNASGQVKLGDLERPFMISGYNEEHKLAEGDHLKLECGAIIYNYSSDIVWRKNGEPIENFAGLAVTETNTKYSWRKSIVWKQISKDDEGDYECEVAALSEHSPPETHQVLIRVHDAQAPSISANFNQSVMQQALGESLKLDCLVSGLPTPELLWYKDGELFIIEETNAENNMQRIMIDNANSSVTFTVLRHEDAGTYRCNASNRVGWDYKEISLEIPAPIAHISQGIIIGVVSLILVLVFISVYLCARVRRERRLIAELKAAGLANFEEGNLESIDPDMNLDEQADLLPYNKDVEFPRDKLKLGKQLGAGAFGIVLKATAQGIVPYEEESTVAVKMVKKQTDNEVMKALVSELKIMIHLGQHLNVVNLLGAVTKNIAKRELMVIVEYCQFGNLQSFLVKHRPYFVDQIRGDKIDPMISKNDLRWSKNSAFNTYNSQGLKYISVTFAKDKVTPKNHNYINVDANHYINCSDGNPYTTQPSPMGVVNAGAHLNSKGYIRHSGFQNNTQVDSCNTEATMLSSTGQGEDSMMLSNNSDQPLWRSNYGMDYKGPARSVCTSDLVCWSFQVARGMDYLSSRKVLHGDLAARNILLAEDNIVKICDFGLARSMYKNDNYKKKGEAPLPFKWLALESISDHVFSTYSDVWAFGVVLWELFTLGKVPYTGMEANQNLYYKLRDGYRMEKPGFANQDVYDIMLNCWNAKPESRPLFRELEQRLGSFLHDSVKDHYVDLNDPYMTANITNYETGRPDYLTQLSCPTTEAPKPPLAEEENFYVNNSVDAKNPSTADYLSMSPKSGIVRYNNNSAHKSDYIRPDSPTIAKNLDTSPKNRAKHPNRKPELPEEIPMLKRNENGALVHADSDEEQNGYTEMSFSNGQSKEVTADPEYKNVFDSSDNYINVAPSKSNPSYITFNTVNERLN